MGPPVRPGSLAPVATARAPPGLRHRPLPVQRELQERATAGPRDRPHLPLQSAFASGEGSIGRKSGKSCCQVGESGVRCRQAIDRSGGGPPPPPPPPPSFCAKRQGNTPGL